MRTSMAVVVWMVLGGSAVAAQAQGGFMVNADQVPWPKLQARIGLATSSAPLTPLLTDLTLPAMGSVQGGRVLGDYYFLGGGLSLGAARINGGFRATSGLLLGSHGASFSMPTVPKLGLALSASQQFVPLGNSLIDTTAGDANHTVPYLGVGYTGLSAKGGWGFTADLGLMALNPGSTSNLTRQSLDDTLRDMRITPVVQLGVSYSF